MKVIACPADENGCGRYRILQPAAVLNATEANVQVEINHEGLRIKQDALGRICGVAPIDADVLVLQRPLAGWIAQAIPHYQRQDVKVVVEVDDDFHSLHPRNGAYASCHPKLSPHSNWNHLLRACAVADLVTVSTPALAQRYGKHGRVAVLRNYVPEAWLRIPRAGSGKTVGWAGVVGSHPDDLQATRGGVGEALAEAGGRFLCVGNGEMVQNNLKLIEEPEVTGYVEFDRYPHELARMDVGIVPLADTRFNHAKSWLKGLEYAALGVPFVASAAQEYVALEAFGIGATVKGRARDWKRSLLTLLRGEEYREWCGAAAREAASFLTIEKQAWRWAEAWEGVL